MLNPPLKPTRPKRSRRASVMDSAKFHNSIGRRKNKLSQDPAAKIAQRHANGLTKVDFLSDQIDRLTVQVETYKVKLATIKNTNDKLDDELYDLSQQTGSALSGTALDDVQKDVDRTITKLLYKLETSLEKSKIKRDTEASKQNSLRYEINQYRTKKLTLRTANDKLENELFDSKDDLTDRLHDLQQAQKQRLHTESHIMALKKMLEGVEHTFETEWSSLTKRIDKERHDIEDVQRRSAAASQARNWEDEVGKGGSILKAVQIHAINQRKLKDRSQQAQHAAAAQRMSYRQEQINLDEYREALALLHKRLAINSADELITRFEDSETSIFARLSQINELTSETEQLENRRRELLDDFNVVEQKSKTKLLHAAREQKTLDEKEKSLQFYIHRVNENLKSVHAIAEKLTNGVEHLYKTLDCEETVPSALDGVTLGGHEITTLNLMLYLGIVQQRSNNVLMLAKKKLNEQNIAKQMNDSRSKKVTISDKENNSTSTTSNSLRSSPLFSKNNSPTTTSTSKKKKSNTSKKKTSPSLSVSGPISPVRNTLERTLQVDLLQMSLQLNQIEQDEKLSSMIRGSFDEEDEDNDLSMSSRRKSRSNKRRSSSRSSNRARSPTMESIKSNGSQRSPSPVRSVTPVAPLSRVALLNGLKQTMELKKR